MVHSPRSRGALSKMRSRETTRGRLRRSSTPPRRLRKRAKAIYWCRSHVPCRTDDREPRGRGPFSVLVPRITDKNASLRPILSPFGSQKTLDLGLSRWGLFKDALGWSDFKKTDNRPKNLKTRGGPKNRGGRTAKAGNQLGTGWALLVLYIYTYIYNTGYLRGGTEGRPPRAPTAR